MKPFVAISCVLLLSACVKVNQRPGSAEAAIEFVRTQTQCSDSWGYGITAGETIAKLNYFLLQQKVTADKITLLATGEQATCAACVCSRGFTFHVWVQPVYADSLTSLGFTVK